MRRKLIAGNWKMNKTPSEALEFCKEFSKKVEGIKDRDIVIFAPTAILFVLKYELAQTNILYGAQNFHWEPKGAFTGEISAKMLIELGCKYVLVGHSERRQYFGETNETCNKKIRAAIENKLIPVYCIGETLGEREAQKTFDVVRTQILEGLKGFDSEFIKDLVIAYEPVWAIGTGINATVEQIEEVHAFIRDGIEKEFGAERANLLRILYGGSVTPDNAKEILNAKDVDGVLVGGASLEPDKFAKIVRYDE